MKKILLVFILLIMAGCNDKVVETKPVYKKVNQQEAVSKINKGAFLVDVRTKEEYKIGHIDNAINIPLDEIVTQKIVDKNDVIIVYCKSGGRSKNAADTLISLGYKYVYDFGSIDDWKS